VVQQHASGGIRKPTPPRQTKKRTFVCVLEFFEKGGSPRCSPRACSVLLPRLRGRRGKAAEKAPDGAKKKRIGQVIAGLRGRTLFLNARSRGGVRVGLIREKGIFAEEKGKGDVPRKAKELQQTLSF